MNNRKSLSQKIRFLVLKFDNFTCQYCGRKAPEVALEVDHIMPVAIGGDDDMTNLITACYECNVGKTDNILDSRFLDYRKKQIDDFLYQQCSMNENNKNTDQDRIREFNDFLISSLENDDSNIKVRMAEERRQRIKSYRESGMSVKDIAAQEHVNPSRIYAILKRAGYVRLFPALTAQPEPEKEAGK